MKNWITAAAVIVAGMATAGGPAAAQSGEASKGQRVFNTQCKACHTVEKDGTSHTGPNLHGLYGRKAGTGGGYESSDAMKNSGIVWDDTTIALDMVSFYDLFHYLSVTCQCLSLHKRIHST